MEVLLLFFALWALILGLSCATGAAFATFKTKDEKNKMRPLDEKKQKKIKKARQKKTRAGWRHGGAMSVVSIHDGVYQHTSSMLIAMPSWQQRRALIA